MSAAVAAPRRSGGDAALVPLLGLLWGLNWPIVRICLTEIPPWTLRASALALGSLCLFGLIRLRGLSPRVHRRDWIALAAIGFFTVAGYNILSAFAQLTTTTTRSAVLSYTMPIWTVLLARIVLGEPLDGRRVLGLGLGIAGLVALGWPLVTSGEMSRGVVFALGSAVFWAIGNTIIKRHPIDADPAVVASWQLALGAVLAGIGMAVFEGWPATFSHSPPVIAAYLYHVILGQAVATALWFAILGRLPAGIASIGSLLVPAVGVVSAAILVGERPTLPDWVGLGLIVAASATVLLRGPQAR